MVCRYRIDMTYSGKKGAGVLGQGSFGKVYLVVDTTTNERYALKTSEKDLCSGVTIISAPESDIHFRLKHPYLMPAVDLFRRGDVDTCGIPLDSVRQGVLLPLMDYDLSEIENDNKDAPKYPQFNSLLAAWQLACGLEALHQAGYAHLDIKPPNILQKGDQTRLADFGLAVSLKTPMITFPVMTPTYRPPYVKYVSDNEVRFNKSDYQAADLFSLGLVFMDLTTGGSRPPWTSPRTRDQQNTYTKQLAEESNVYLDQLADFLKKNENYPNFLEQRQKRWRLPLASVDAMFEFLRLIKGMITPTPTTLKASDVRRRLEYLWPAHPPVPKLLVVPNAALNMQYNDEFWRIVTDTVPVTGDRHQEHLMHLFLAVMTFATPDPSLYIVAQGYKSWVLSYYYACAHIVSEFYPYGPTDITFPYYDPMNARLYDDAYTGPVVSADDGVCAARVRILESKELQGRFNFILPGDPTLSVVRPPAVTTRRQAGQIQPAKVNTGTEEPKRGQPTGLALYTAFRSQRYPDLVKQYGAAEAKTRLAEAWKAQKAATANPSQPPLVSGTAAAGATGGTGRLAQYYEYRRQRLPELMQQYPPVEARQRLHDEWKAMKKT